MSSSWLRWLDEPSDKLELAELNGCSDGHGDGELSPTERASDGTLIQPSPERRRGLYLGRHRNGTVKEIFYFLHPFYCFG